MALEDASTTKKGIVQLSSATNSTSESLAATPKAVKAAYDLTNGKYTAQDATTAQKGIIQLSSATNSTSETLAATPKAVKSAYDNAEKRLQKDQNGADIPDKGRFLNNINAVSKTDFADKRGMRYVRVNAPAGATSGKYYPVVVMRSAGSVSELASRVIITTATRTAGDPMNNCEFNGFVMPGGWTDRGRYAYGMFWQYQNNERAIHSIMMSNKGDDLRSVFYVDGAAFPVFAFIEDGLSISAPGADLVVNDTTYKFGATNPATECIAADVILDFKSGREARGKSTDFWSLPLPQETKQYVPKMLALSDILKNSKRYGVRLPTTDESRALARVHLSSPVEMAKVADMAGISVSKLKTFNAGVKGSTLGASGPQYVMVPKKHADQLRESLASGEIAAVQSTLVADNTPLNSRVYTVRSGDTLSSIASRLGVSTKDLQQWNKLRGSKLKPGQSLTIGAGSSAQRLANNSDSITYRVRKGDSLSSIAKRHGVNIKDVMRWNSDTANLQPGDKLTLFVKNNNMPDS